MDGEEDEDGDKENWVWLFYLPPLEEAANAQGGTRCSLLDQVSSCFALFDLVLIFKLIFFFDMWGGVQAKI